MSQQGMRTFSTEFKKAVVLRLEAGERIAAVSEKLRIRRKLLYEWRAAYRKLGAGGLNRKRGRKPGGACASPDAAPATPAPLTELARAQARIAELERKIGKQQMDLVFFALARFASPSGRRRICATKSRRSRSRTASMAIGGSAKTCGASMARRSIPKTYRATCGATIRCA